MNLLRAAGPRDEELDAQDVAPFMHGQDVGHPGSDPFQVLRGSDDPDEEHASGGDGAGCVAGDEVAHEGDLVGYADAAGE